MYDAWSILVCLYVLFEPIIYFLYGWIQKLIAHHILYLMHIEKNVCESIFGTLLDIKYKSKDGKNSCDELQ